MRIWGSIWPCQEWAHRQRAALTDGTSSACGNTRCQSWRSQASDPRRWAAVGKTLVGTEEDKEEEEAAEEAEAKKVPEQEEAALLARGFGNHRLELEAEAGSGAETDAFGEKRGWGSSALDGMMTPFTGKETYEFGDLTLAGLRGRRALVGTSVETGVRVALTRCTGLSTSLGSRCERRVC